MHYVDFFILPLLKRYRRNTAENRHSAKFWIEWFTIVRQHTTCVSSKTLGSLLPTWFFLCYQILSVVAKLSLAPLLNLRCAPTPHTNSPSYHTHTHTHTTIINPNFPTQLDFLNPSHTHTTTTSFSVHLTWFIFHSPVLMELRQYTVILSYFTAVSQHTTYLRSKVSGRLLLTWVFLWLKSADFSAHCQRMIDGLLQGSPSYDVRWQS